MPIYEYECQKCKSVWEAIRPVDMKENPLQCPCGGDTKVVPSVPARAQFQGDGWTPIHHSGSEE